MSKFAYSGFSKVEYFLACLVFYDSKLYLLGCGQIETGLWKTNHPKLASELKTCPYNARHLVPKHELAYHTETCEDRINVDPEHEGNTNGFRQVPVSTWVNPDMTEDWDKEADDSAAPFVWGMNTIFTQKSETRPTNNLSPSCRAPATLPWSGYSS
ncbi:gametocyte-specific factor 1 [Scomber scombrus]|uniref:Gametocyte-specific factor 1 n=1 Tax=Scomber scombrus TaxID=13677 RepID=A0AAV1NWD0_SCOSC